jgi:hypothetical protein
MLLARAKIVEKMIVRAAASGTGIIAVQTLTGVQVDRSRVGPVVRLGVRRPAALVKTA